MSVNSLVTNRVGQQTASVLFQNYTTDPSKLAIRGSARDRRALVMLYYRALGPNPSVGPEVVFEGYMDGAVMDDKQLNVSLVSRSNYFGTVPRLILGPPYVNHAPVPGTVYNWGEVSDGVLDKRR
jgi:hypothetical protein